MVLYCCVKGCGNNSREKKKNPNVILSFHGFPTNENLRSKWLKAIGRPNWDPPSYSRICNIHFNTDQINTSMCRTRIKDEACPVNALPPNSNFEASDIEVCRICLATDLKMFNIHNGVLKIYMETMKKLHDKMNMEGLPQYVCYQCHALISKCYKFIEMSLATQTILLDIFAKNNEITKQLIRSSNRKDFNIVKLDFYKVVDNIFCYNENESNENSKINNMIYITNDNYCDLIVIESENVKDESSIEENITTVNDDPLITRLDKNDVSDVTMIKNMKNEIKIVELNENTIDNDNEQDIDSDENSNISLNNFKEVDTVRHNISEAIQIEIQNESNKNQNKDDVEVKFKKTKQERLTPKELSMVKYFKIINLSQLKEQTKYWIESNEKFIQRSETKYQCDICRKLFAHKITLEMHIVRHDPSRGSFECPVCKLRFKSEVFLRSHLKNSHMKKFHCKLCSKIYTKLSHAKKHHSWHMGHVYKCESPNCEFSTRHFSALGKHMRTLNHGVDAGDGTACGRHPCAACGRGFVSRRGLLLHRSVVHSGMKICDTKPHRCDQCDAVFMTEGAKRVHILTNTQHRNKPFLREINPADNVCNKCGVEFGSLGELRLHRRAEHPSPRRSYHRLPGDSYPSTCEFCQTTVSSRREHYWHMRRSHPALMPQYTRVVHALCHLCGKGFQNITKLKVHVSRHTGELGGDGLRCSRCPQKCTDRDALRRHERRHAMTSRGAHACATCGKTFALEKYLARHTKVHSDETPYCCGVCGKKFKWSSGRNAHMRTLHKRTNI